MLPFALLSSLLLAGALGLENCPDRSALNKVNVWVHQQSGGVGEAIETININELEAYTMIDIVKANVSVLCDGMIKMFPRLEHLTLVNVNISDILPEAFQKVPKLRHLSLSVNNITRIKRDQFKNLPNLQVLYLSKNKIDDIDSDAFELLPSLEKIYLDRNLLHEIDSGWFLKNAKLGLIDLAYNSISKLQSAAFTMPDELPRNNELIRIRLQHNYIEMLETNAVIAGQDLEGRNMPHLSLYLEHNNLRSLDDNFVTSIQKNSNIFINTNYIECVSDKALEFLEREWFSLHLDHNPISCDCMEKINKFIEQHELRATLYYNSTLDCQLAGFRPAGFYPGNFK